MKPIIVGETLHIIMSTEEIEAMIREKLFVGDSNEALVYCKGAEIVMPINKMKEI